MCLTRKEVSRLFGVAVRILPTTCALGLLCACGHPTEPKATVNIEAVFSVPSTNVGRSTR